MRGATIATTLLAAAALAACGGSGGAGAGGAGGAGAGGGRTPGYDQVAGSAPVVGKPTKPAAGATRLNEAAHGTGERAAAGTGTAATAPQSQSAPCTLVSARQASAILGAPVRAPATAPQGPTCVYRTKDGRGFVTLSLRQASLSSLVARTGRRQRLTLAKHAAYCGNYGQQMLYAQAGRGFVLSVAAPCGIAKRFAERALPHVFS